MLGNMVSLEEIDYNQIIQAAGGPFLTYFQVRFGFNCELTMIPKMTSILQQLCDKVLPNLPPRDNRSFFLIDRSRKRSKEDIMEVLQVISAFNRMRRLRRV